MTLFLTDVCVYNNVVLARIAEDIAKEDISKTDLSLLGKN